MFVHGCAGSRERSLSLTSVEDQVCVHCEEHELRTRIKNGSKSETESDFYDGVNNKKNYFCLGIVPSGMLYARWQTMPTSVTLLKKEEQKGRTRTMALEDMICIPGLH